MDHAGIEQLKADLRTNAMHYHQNKFGRITPECGTEACMAGLCLMAEIGPEAFTAEVKAGRVYDSDFIEECLQAGARRLGLSLLDEDEYRELAADETGDSGDGLPPIFSGAEYWPDDLREAYEDAERGHDHPAMAEVACMALDRIDRNGRFIP